MKRVLAAVVLLGAAAALYLAWARIAAWAQHVGGFRNGDGNSPWYLFPSGWGSILLPPLITLAGIAALWAWHHQCQVTGCYWPARRLTAANERACWRHHPHPRRTADDIRAAHHLYLGKQPGKG